MPENRPGRAHYATNDTEGTLDHGQPVAIDNRVGVAIKQKGVGWEHGLDAQAVIQEDEDFLVFVKGTVLVDEVAEAAKGDAIYIDPTTNKLTKTAEKNLAFGRVLDAAGERGVPTKKMRVDLDAKDNI